VQVFGVRVRNAAQTHSATRRARHVVALPGRRLEPRLLPIVGPDEDIDVMFPQLVDERCDIPAADAV
jgi:hypothetical protein